MAAHGHDRNGDSRFRHRGERGLADDWQRCMTIEQEAERLACLDAAANATGRPHPTDTGRDERSVIISRCQAQTGEFGSVMVRACIAEDMAAYEALQTFAG